jgi:hypothetical protein
MVPATRLLEMIGMAQHCRRRLCLPRCLGADQPGANRRGARFAQAELADVLCYATVSPGGFQAQASGDNAMRHVWPADV